MESKNDLRYLADLMDQKFRGPLGFRFGWDGLIGLVPGVGDFVGNLFSGYIILRAFSLKYPASILFRMLINLGVENLVGVLPFLGNIFDFFWKANTKNLELLEAFDRDPHTVRRRSFWSSVLVLSVLCVAILGLLGLSLWVLIAIVQYLRTV